MTSQIRNQGNPTVIQMPSGEQQDISGLIKAQMMSMGMMNGGGNQGGMYTMIIGMILMSLIDLISKQLPLLIKTCKELIDRYFQKKTRDLQESLISRTVDGKETVLKSEITFERTFDSDNSDETSEAILDLCCKKNNALKLAFRNGFFVSNYEPFLLLNSPEIYFKLIEVKRGQEDELNLIIFKIYSYKIELYDLRKEVQQISEYYTTQKKNELGDHKFFFDEISMKIPKNMDGSYRMDQAPTSLHFTMTRFSTTKSLDNLYGSHIHKIQKRVNHFISNPEWYSKNGVPYTLGLLLYGKPGCGKTSIIKAIAKDTRRHIINLKLTETTTQTQLKNLFFNDLINVTQNGMTKTYYIPTSDRIYVMEDIDCLSNVVLSREQSEQSVEEIGIDLDPTDFEELVKSNKEPVEESVEEVKETDLSNCKKTFADGTPLFEPVSKAEAKELDKFFKNVKGNTLNSENQTKKELVPSDYPSVNKIDVSKVKSFDAQETNFTEMEPGANSVKELDKSGIHSGLQANEVSSFDKPVSFPIGPPVETSNSNQEPDDRINLSFILNLFDGVLETPGRIFIMTTNYPDRLDAALTRPGRVDLKIEFTPCNNSMIVEMFRSFYEISDEEFENYKELESIPSGLIRPCELQSILNNNYDSSINCLAEIKKEFKI